MFCLSKTGKWRWWGLTFFLLPFLPSFPPSFLLFDSIMLVLPIFGQPGLILVAGSQLCNTPSVLCGKVQFHRAGANPMSIPKAFFSIDLSVRWDVSNYQTPGPIGLCPVTSCMSTNPLWTFCVGERPTALASSLAKIGRKFVGAFDALPSQSAQKESWSKTYIDLLLSNIPRGDDGQSSVSEHLPKCKSTTLGSLAFLHTNPQNGGALIICGVGREVGLFR